MGGVGVQQGSLGVRPDLEIRIGTRTGTCGGTLEVAQTSVER